MGLHLFSLCEMPNVKNQPTLGSGSRPDKICYGWDSGWVPSSNKANGTCHVLKDGERTCQTISSKNCSVYASTEDIWTPLSAHLEHNKI